MKCENAPGIRVALQDVFLSDTPLSRRPEKTPLQGETPRPDFDTLTSADSHFGSTNSKKQPQIHG